jgi:tRNA (guanine37-N1)-methyltransferase
MKIDILTLFPEMFKGPFEESIVKRAQEKSLVEIKIHNLRKWAKDKHKTVDDRPFGGGAGMILIIEPIFKALKSLGLLLRTQNKTTGESCVSEKKTKVILLGPTGKVFNQKKACQLAKMDHLIFICGHYEGVDERVREHLVDEEISIGDYILTGGEIPAMVMVDTVVRLIPGVLEKPEAIKTESFSPLLEYPQYTRPEDFKGWKVPKILLSGDHKKIADWRKKKSLERTRKRRPDLLKA